MNASPSVKAPTWFTVIAVLAVIWNVLGLVSFYMHVSMTPEAVAQLPEAEQALINAYPGWLTGIFAIAVLAGTLGSVLLLLKKSVALPVLVVSLIAVLIQFGYWILVMKSYEVMGPGSLVVPILIIAVAICLVFLANQAKKRGWTA